LIVLLAWEKLTATSVFLVCEEALLLNFSAENTPGFGDLFCLGSGNPIF